MKLVSIVTVNYNHSHVTEDLLQSLMAVNKYPSLEIIVVDNGSKDDPTPIWRQTYPNVHFIRSEVNTGFAGGNNIGIRAAKGDYLFLINNDTEVTPSLIGLLVDLMEQRPEIGMASPKIRYFESPQLIQYAGYTKVNYFTGRNACIGQFEPDEGQYDHQIHPTAYAHGAAMMVRRDAIDKAGLMREGYFLYYEELDWSERIRRAGYEIYVCLPAVIFHKESVSVGRNTALKTYYMIRNRILFLRYFASTPSFILFCFYYAFFVVPRNMISFILNGDAAFIPVMFRAIGWHFKHSPNSENL